MKKIGIATVFTGYNYGSLLQAFSMQQVLKELKIENDIIKLEGSLIKGRDVRGKKIAGMLGRGMTHPIVFRNTINAYTSANNQSFDEETKKIFDEFAKKNLITKTFNYSDLKKVAKTDFYDYFVAGSDQIWNSYALYVDPFYYLRFAPKEKRIAYAPSFGKSNIPSYNKKVISKYIRGFQKLSIREQRGQELIRELTSQDVPVMLDPSLLLSRKKWNNLITPVVKDDYILFYFLNEPQKENIEVLQTITSYFNKKIIILPKKAEWHKHFREIKYLPTGPLDFVSLINNATFVCTDSFHGAAFSINMNTPFLVFDRNYQQNTEQSSRLISLLKKLELEKRFIKNNNSDDVHKETMTFEKQNEILEYERSKAFKYLEALKQ